MDCLNCGGGEWVCENHRDRPLDTCGCGAGAPCPVCKPVMACATYSEPWREAATALYDLLWMAEEWMERSGESSMLGTEYRADLNRAEALFAKAQGDRA